MGSRIHFLFQSLGTHSPWVMYHLYEPGVMCYQTVTYEFPLSYCKHHQQNTWVTDWLPTPTFIITPGKLLDNLGTRILLQQVYSDWHVLVDSHQFQEESRVLIWLAGSQPLIQNIPATVIYEPVQCIVGKEKGKDWYQVPLRLPILYGAHWWNVGGGPLFCYWLRPSIVLTCSLLS